MYYKSWKNSMKVQEIISEAISISHWGYSIKEKLEEIKKTPLRSVCKFEKYVDDTGRNVFEASCNFTEKYSHLKRIRFYENQTPDEVQDTVNRWFDIRDFYVIYKLEEICTKLLEPYNPNHHKISIVRRQKGKNTPAGEAGYSNIKLYVDLDTNSNSVDEIMQQMYWKNAITKNGLNLDLVESILNDKSITIAGKCIAQFINLVSTIVHELVHIRQHLTQSKDFIKQKIDKKTGLNHIFQGTEYRSKLEPDVDKFRDAVDHVYRSPEDRKIYHSSLQEIPAHAHNAAFELADTYVDAAIYRKDLNDLNKSFSKIFRNIQQGKGSNTLEYYNTEFNHPNNKVLYDVYRRFIKILHQEIHNLYNHTAETINNL